MSLHPENDGGPLVHCVSCGASVTQTLAVKRGWGTMLDENGRRGPCCSRDCAATLYTADRVARCYADPR